MSSYVAEICKLIKANSSAAACTPYPVPSYATFPMVTVSMVHGKELESLNGRSGMIGTIIQIDCWDKVHETAWSLQKVIKDYLIGFKGTAGSQVIEAVNHNVDAEFYDGNRSLHQVVTRLFIWWSE